MARWRGRARCGAGRPSLTIAPGEDRPCRALRRGQVDAGEPDAAVHDLESGRILIDGRDIAQVTQESLRAAIGVVTQDTSLLHRSIRDNIAWPP